MSLRRWSTPAVLVLGVLAIACQTKPPTTGSGLSLSLTSATNSSTVAPGGTMVVLISAQNGLADGNTVGVVGTVVVSVQQPADATVSPGSVTTDSTGAAMVTFTMCSDSSPGNISPKCASGQPVTLNATLTAAGSSTTASITFTLPPYVDGGDAGLVCTGVGACSNAACDEQVCSTGGDAGVCDTTANVCEPGDLLVIEKDPAGSRLNPAQLPEADAYIEIDVLGVPQTIADHTLSFTVSPSTLGGFLSMPPPAPTGTMPLFSLTQGAPTANLATAYFVPSLSSTTSSGTITVKVDALASQTIAVTFVGQVSPPDAGQMDGGSIAAQNTYTLAVTMTNASTGEVNMDGRVQAGGQESLNFAATLTQTTGTAGIGSVPLCFTVPNSLLSNGTLGGISIGEDAGTAGQDGGSPCEEASGPDSTAVAVVTDIHGNASITFDPGPSVMPRGGALEVTIGGALAGSAMPFQQNILVVVPSVIQFTSAPTGGAFNSLMGVKGSGFQETSELQFTIFDSTNQPYLGPAEVLFAIPSGPSAPDAGTSDGGSSLVGVGGAFLAPTSGSTVNGVATTTVSSGTQAGTLNVTATAIMDMTNRNLVSVCPPTDTCITLTTDSTTIAIVGAKANARNFAMVCGDDALPALVGNDCSFMQTNMSTECTVVIGDRFNNTLGVPTQVQWRAESGLFGPPTVTNSSGVATNTLATLNAPVPESVDSAAGGFDAGYPGEPVNFFMTPNKCGQLETRPRDGLSTVIAFTQGEEGFDDSNQNGQWDPGELFYDLGEPYVDENDNNQYDVGEPFVDVNGNGKWDGPNGVWDSNTTIWTSWRVAFTDLPTAEWNPARVGPLNTGDSLPVEVRWSDSNGNESAPQFTTYVIGMAGVAAGSVTQTSVGTNLIDQWGSMHVTRPTSCGPSNATVILDGGVDGGPACPGGGSCDCTITTEISFDQREQLAGTYAIPGSAVPVGPDDLRGTAIVTLVGQTIADNSDQFVTLNQPIDAGPPDAGLGGFDAGINCVGPTACAQTMCDQQVCATSDGGNGVCDNAASVCEPGSLLVLESDLSGFRLNPAALPVGAPYFRMTAQEVPGSLAGASVTFSVSPTSLGGFSSTPPTPGAAAPTTLTVSATGNVATVYFVPAVAAPATGTITARTASASQAVSVAFVEAGLVSFTPGSADAFSTLMGVKSSGYNETNVVRFTVYDNSGNPVTQPATVTFSLEALGGTSGGSNAPNLSPVTTTTSPNGQVTTLLHSGVVAESLHVTATATLSSGAVVVGNSPDIAIVGAKASGNNFTVLCDHDTVNALVGNNCEKITQDLSVSCTAVLADRFGNTLGTSALISWQSESGFFGPPTTTPTYVVGGNTSLLGRSVNTLQTLSSAVPLNVDDVDAGYTNEPVSPGPDSCGRTNTRPRDGLVTFIAYTQGEDGFYDKNGNGAYDTNPPEPFYDQGEPYIDENDNNVHDSNEPFIDLNGNGAYDGPSSTWQANTTIWTVGHILFSDTPTGTITNTNPTTLAFNAKEPYTVTWQDENLNRPAPLDTTFAFTLTTGSLGTFVQTSFAQLPDSFGALAVGTNSVCVGAACLNETALTFPSVSPQQVGKYTAPLVTGAPNGFDDTIQFTAAMLAEKVTAVASQTEDFLATCDTTLPSTVNCILPACNGKTCQTASGIAGACDSAQSTCVPNEQASGTFSMSVFILNPNGSPSSLRVAAGSQALSVIATLTPTGSVSAAGLPIIFTLPSYVGTLTEEGNASNTGASITVLTNSGGTAKAQLTPEATTSPQAGDLVISSTPPGSQEIVLDNVITVVVPGEIVFSSSATTSGFNQIMGVKGSGYQENSVLSFSVLDSGGEPYVGSALVFFTVPEEQNGVGLGGSKVTPSELNTNVNGEATTTLLSGVAAGTIAVTATTTIDITNQIPVAACPAGDTCITLTGTSSVIAIIGAKANGRNFSMSCSPYSLPALIGNDCSFMKLDLTSTCTVVVGDRYNNVLGVAQEISWLSEAALFGPPSTTTAAVALKDPTLEPLLGRSSNTLRTYGAPMPANVDAMETSGGIGGAPLYPNEPSSTVMTSCGLTGTRPRDGLVTVIAATQGEEGYIDLKASGHWDPGDPFWDLGEPYVDSNDNNQYDLGEPFIDVNGNGKWDGPNGVWDSNTTIWTAWHIAFTDVPSADTDDSLSQYRRWYPDGINSATNSLLPDNVTQGSLAPISIFWADENLNQPAQTFASYGVSYADNAVGGFVSLDSSPNPTDSWGSMNVTQPTTCTTGAQPICTVNTNITFNMSSNVSAIFNPGSATTSSTGYVPEQVSAECTYYQPLTTLPLTATSSRFFAVLPP